MIKRRLAKIIKIGCVSIGGNNPLAIQSMTKCATADVETVLRQIKELASCGCEIVRLSVENFSDARALKKIKPFSRLPLVADIHFDYRLALAAIDRGVDKIRLNPGNIYKKEEIREVARAAKMARIPIRVGVNSGSLRRCPAQGARGKNTADMMVNSALNCIKILEKFAFSDIVVSLKASNMFDTIDAYRKAAKLCAYPLHLGMTATGAPSYGIVTSAICLGTLLSHGLGDTIRISLTDRPAEEVKVAKNILAALKLRDFGPQIISCPTCGRCGVNLIKIVDELGNRLSAINHKLSTPIKTLAVMGCVVNGPGEAKEADLGIAFGKTQGLLFKKGKPLRKISSDRCVKELLKEMEKR
jgi:(E)-4-hydroxy-3-methylbut-2-enyl-diphosphate synthase